MCISVHDDSIQRSMKTLRVIDGAALALCSFQKYAARERSMQSGRLFNKAKRKKTTPTTKPPRCH